MLNERETTLFNEARSLLCEVPFEVDIDDELLEGNESVSMSRIIECYDYEEMCNVALCEIVGTEFVPDVGLVNGRMIGIVFENSTEGETFIVIDGINQQLLLGNEEDKFTEEDIVTGNEHYIDLFQKGLKAIKSRIM